ncbi:MAG TPA: roadblock/LC7 domain-containing protein [Acidobacteriota bacterium]|nr:roadblock/LC7 domain-containing protein [Acidobacteriota bacterium]
MEVPNFKIESQEYQKIVLILSNVLNRTGAKSVCLINRNGQDVAHRGSLEGLDIQALASLAASNLAATFGLATLIGEDEFHRIYHRGRNHSIVITPVSNLALILVIVPAQSEQERDWRSLGQASLILEDILRKCGNE